MSVYVYVCVYMCVTAAVVPAAAQDTAAWTPSVENG